MLGYKKNQSNKKTYKQINPEVFYFSWNKKTIGKKYENMKILFLLLI